MRIPAFPIAASLVLLAAPAFAQTSGMTGNQTYGTSQSATNPSNSSNMSSQWHSSGISTDTQQKIRQSLDSAGFRNVQVTPEAFVIRAQAPDGSHVVMLLRPDELMGVIRPSSVSQGSGSMQSGMSGSSQPYGSSQQPYGSMQGSSSGWNQGNTIR